MCKLKRKAPPSPDLQAWHPRQCRTAARMSSAGEGWGHTGLSRKPGWPYSVRPVAWAGAVPAEPEAPAQALC